MTAQTKSKIIRILFFAFLIGLLVVEITYSLLQYSEEAYITMSRFIGGGACIVFMVDFSITKILKPYGNKKMLLGLLVIPGFVIAINNFPFVSFLSDNCGVSGNWMPIITFALVCIGTGFFEEMAFRGCVFMLVLKGKTQSRKKIFVAILLSSLVFGVIHLANLFFGASPIAVLLQIGYSALIGALCSMVLLITGNIWLCVLLHATYNFCGGLIGLDNVGFGIQWTTPQMIFTAAVAVVAAIYFVILFFKMPISLAEDLFESKKVEISKAE